LLEYADTEYIMFSDQDDVWLPNKIELTLNAMKAAEQVYPDRPILIHTDLKVTDSELNIIADSLWSYQKLFPEAGDDLNRIMAQNVVTGCTVMINKKAKTVSIPVPHEAVMYDWWLALNVCRHGKIIYVSIPSVLYRQHSRNRLGAQKARKINIVHFLKKLRHLKKLLSAHYRMLKKFDPRASFGRLVLNKALVKIAQRCR
jgi:glycosyltransferase involved in cell wall biosynthesis